MPGNLFIVSAPSGAGKTSLVHALLNINPLIKLSVSYTTRNPRPGEHDGKDYHFVSRETFVAMMKRGEFLESAEVYGNLYGTSQTWISQETTKGQDILLEIDWQGAAQVRHLFPECVSIFILPPSMEALEQRLKGRGKDNDEIIARRMAAVRNDVAHVAEFDYVIINDNLNEALRELNAVVLAARLKCASQLARHQALINQLQNPE
ncbi:MAG: guanylate kinase [Gallionellales bacterium RIFCSPLOWO2_12_FULL_59_22]|nr:MAG: guanylate kinase [Gallionellales bacterium RIFCSPLOWO2_02_FULL_59_110]OGT02941.1 MAG: guanylate kinase [Gallionellales bacterium RIFCSPLOWO2_02_58_13]OGT13028.1 MAG: guanylate kinase [Gallionellales bacterium RIFCSPLOWO2_12_FULL_59_22]